MALWSKWPIALWSKWQIALWSKWLIALWSKWLLVEPPSWCWSPYFTHCHTAMQHGQEVPVIWGNQVNDNGKQRGSTYIKDTWSMATSSKSSTHSTLISCCFWAPPSITESTGLVWIFSCMTVKETTCAVRRLIRMHLTQSKIQWLGDGRTPQCCGFLVVVK